MTPIKNNNQNQKVTCCPVIMPKVVLMPAPKNSFLAERIKTHRYADWRAKLNLAGSRQKKFLSLHINPHSRPCSQAHPSQLVIDKSLNRSPSTPRPLRVRLSLNGEKQVSFFLPMAVDSQCSFNEKEERQYDYRTGPILTVDRDLYHAKKQQLIGQGEVFDSVNNHIKRVDSLIRSIAANQQAKAKAGLSQAPTIASVMAEFLGSSEVKGKVVLSQVKAPLTPDISVYDALDRYVTEVLSNQSIKLSSETIEKWQYSVCYLKAYLTATDQENTSCRQITMGWAKRYHAWLLSGPKSPGPGRIRTQKPIALSVGTASRHVSRLKGLFTYFLEEDLLDRNPLAGLRLSKGKTKAVYFLEANHLNRLFTMEQPEDEFGCALWWIKLMCLTGLDYPDAVKYMNDRSAYERETENGYKIVIERSKAPHNECHIYMLNELFLLLNQQPANLKVLKHDALNNYIKRNEVSKIIGFPFQLTCKIARKTAGNYFLRKGFSIEGVSGTLGHTSIAMTESHYVKVTGAVVDQQAARLIQTDRSIDIPAGRQPIQLSLAG